MISIRRLLCCMMGVQQRCNRVEEDMTETDRYYAHKTACVICLNQQAQTGSGLCLYGFCAFLGFQSEVWKKLKELQAKCTG